MTSDPAKPLFLVTGATGFVGRALCRRLAPIGRIRALSRREREGEWVEHFAADLGSDEPLDGATAGVDCVFHLAGLTHDIHTAADANAYERVNVTGTRRLVDSALRAGVQRLVFLSSVKALGEGDESGLAEDDPPRPASPYGATKLAAEGVVLASGVAHCAVVRSALVYGPGVGGNLERMIRAIDRGVFPPLPERGNRRAMIHVEDLVTMLILAAERPAANGVTYLVTDRIPYSTRRMYEWICAALGRRVPRWHIPWPVLIALGRIGDAAGHVLGRAAPFDSSALDKLLGSAWYEWTRAERDLGFEPKQRFRDALPEIVAGVATRA